MSIDLPSEKLENFCRKFGVLVRYRDDGVPAILISEDTDLASLDFARHVLKARPKVIRVSSSEMAALQDREFGSMKPKLRDDDRTTNSVAIAVPGSSDIVGEINALITQCVDERASDIHFEPAENLLLCRARIDGMLVNKLTKRRDLAPEIISRIKIMAGLDIAEKRRPQDGRIRFEHSGRIVDIRVSVIPTDFGEKAVLRLLDRAQLKLDLGSLGMLPDQLIQFKKGISSPNGMVLVTGPTGSGKTTTLYAALNSLKSESVNICTVEDPIEYCLEGLNQTQVKPTINLTFGAMLRALLRQDPNVIMVGEIRDRETLEIAIRASLTGHMVLSTVHTNSSVSTIPRLLDMGAEPYLLASSLRLIAAQRLMRLNCSFCIDEELSESQRVIGDRLELALSGNAKSSRGCVSCNMTGYSGRIAIYEMLSVDDDISDSITTGKSENEIGLLAQNKSLKQMIEVATDLINQGKTTPSEILRELRSAQQ